MVLRVNFSTPGQDVWKMWSSFMFQDDLDGLQITVDFIMDNVRAIKKSQDVYTIEPHPGPRLEPDGYRTVDYVAVWPCTNQRISIQVYAYVIYTVHDPNPSMSSQSTCSQLTVKWKKYENNQFFSYLNY